MKFMNKFLLQGHVNGWTILFIRIVWLKGMTFIAILRLHTILYVVASATINDFWSF